MSIKAINTPRLDASKKYSPKENQYAKNNSPAFTGLEAVPVVVADAINNGGFAFSFIAQDCFGMAAPRVLEGINRRPVNPETGKKEGPYNWAFARREGIRELLSGPSAFIIPAVMLKFIKKYSGQANNVPIDMIQGLGANFINYASKNSGTLDNVAKTRKEFYHDLFKNVLNTTLEGKLPEEELEKLSTSYMQKAIEIEGAKDRKKSLWKKIANQKVEGSPEDLTASFLDDFMALKKKHLSSSVNELTASFTVNPEKIGKYGVELTNGDTQTIGFKKLLKTVTDFTDDVIETTGAAMKKAQNGFDAKKAEEFLKNFVDRRTGSRIITNLGMWGAVVGFYALIPTLYSLGLKGNPSFQNTEAAKDEPQKTDKKDKKSGAKDVSFSGRHEVFAKTAHKVAESPKLKGFLSHFEFDDAAMSVPAMMGLLFGFCFPTRLRKAIKDSDKYDVKETCMRDLTSFGTILFAANAVARGFSVVFSKLSGLALNIKPDNHTNFFNKFKNYFSPLGGVNVMNNTQLESKYTNIHQYAEGINGFFDFITSNGGNLKKMLQLDKTVAENVKTVIGKDLKDATDDEIKAAFKNITTDEAKKAKKAIEDVFKNKKNIFVKRSKLYNSLFTALSTIALVPAFMIWLARKCDKMTRNARAKDEMKLQAAKAAEQQSIKAKSSNIKLEPQPSMAGFLNK